jgi:hypothetical protein
MSGKEAEVAEPATENGEKHLKNGNVTLAS